MTTKPLSGYTIVITGTLSVPRAEFARLLEEAGATVKSTITRDTTILVLGDNVGEGKVDKARELGVSMYSEKMARAAMSGACGITQIRSGPFIQKVFGSSDDRVNLMGEVSDELEGGDEDTFIRFTNGTYIKIAYNDEGIWRASVLDYGRAKVRKQHGIPDDEESDMVSQAHEDTDAPSYSDVVIIESEEPIGLESWGHKPLSPPRAGLTKAKAIIGMIESRAGGDAWWSDIDQDAKTEILDEIARIVEEKV